MTEAKPKRVPVSERALIQRIQRRLQAQGHVLKRTRDAGQARLDLGKFYVLDTAQNFILETEVDLEGYGRALGALAAHETLLLEPASP